ncbi:MAG: LolA family protein [Crocinitomicaceae bacterium]|jgi:outer membrane lipoprotein-sorting protein
MKNIAVLLFISIYSLGFSQEADAILNRVVTKINSVKDYSVDANIKADIPLIKILPVKASIYFKQKDKFKVVSKGIAILPKQGFTDVNSFLMKKNSYMAVDGGVKTINEVKTNLITVIPTNENSEFVLAKLWIDTKNDLILKSQITTRSSGTVTVDYSYDTEAEYGLPNQLIFDIDVKKFKLPKSVAADLNKTEKEKAKKNKNKDQKGKITIKLTNYKINKGISDDFFKEKN